MSFLSGITSELGSTAVPKPKMPTMPTSPKMPKTANMPGMPSFNSTAPTPVDSSLEPSGSVGVARWLNIASILLVIAVITMAITQQVGYGMPPSELGVLQRSALVGACLAPILNLLFGMRPQHYALALFAAVVGAAASGKEIISHASGQLTVDPNEIVLGRPLYQWAFVIFLIAIIGVAVFLLWVNSWMALDYGLVHHYGPSRTWAFASIIWLIFYVIFTIIQIPVQCGAWSCPADPTSSGAQSFTFTISVSGSEGGEAAISIPGFITVMIAIGLLSLIIGAILNHRMSSQKDGTSSTSSDF
jgi:disulfide bond formation protein DsbB